MVLFRVQAFQKGLAGVDDELFNAALSADCGDELYHLLPGVMVVHTESALDSHGDRHVFSHFSAYSCYCLGFKHQNCAEAPVSCLVARAAAVDVHFVITPFFHDFGCFGHFNRVVAPKLEHNGVLVGSKIHNAIAAISSMDYCVLIDHLSVEESVFGHFAHQVSEELVADVHHRRHRKILAFAYALRD